MPKVSVIIPTYNRAGFLPGAVHSVLNQTFHDFEILVVDDASSDNTAAVVSSLRDKRIRYIRHNVNRRIAGARNTGVVNAGGDHIAFLDDDDEWQPTKLAQQVDLLDRSAEVVGAIYTAFAQIDLASGMTVRTIRPRKRGHILHDLCARNLIGTASTVCVRRRCFDEVGLFDEEIEFGEEYDMWIRLAHIFDFRYIDQVLVRYGVHTARLSTNYPVMIRGLERQLTKHGEFFAADPSNLSRRYRTLGTLYCYGANARQGRRAFREAIRTWPFAVANYLYLTLASLGAGIFRKVSERKRRL